MLRKVRLVSWMIVATLMVGCQKPHPVAFTKWFTQEVALSPRDATNAYDGYVRAASLAREADPLGLRRVSFTEGQRKSSQTRLRGAMAELSQATTKTCHFEFRPTMPFVENPNHAGWRLLGRVLIWRLEDAVSQGDSRDIERATRQAHKFAMDLMMGGAAEADLGLSLVDEVRRTLAPNLGQFSADSLRRLAAILQDDAIRGDWLDEAIENEHKSMLAGVQLVQDAYLAGKLNDLQVNLGMEVREAIDYLNSMHRQSAEQQVAYFTGFAKEADLEASWARQQVLLPVAQRKDVEFSKNEVRPWKRLSKHFFRGLRPLLSKESRTLARTRLLVLECWVLAQAKSEGVAPKNLNGTAKGLNQDPFTGKPFCYEADGPVFKLYSPGSDFGDNGGKTGEDFESPDLTIER